ncbi:hypothetical protein TNCV_2066921 [Trichonephila clavipes]|uniref:Uncharacterized protein n=1 Tax=Trichonephila clavipes TaxID=2585209 RepID=A0A8X6W3F5_TRICX|nr:hypothetical protein TNCV_2066921 [Trichonephila clavipes]
MIEEYVQNYYIAFIDIYKVVCSVVPTLHALSHPQSLNHARVQMNSPRFSGFETALSHQLKPYSEFETPLKLPGHDETFKPHLNGDSGLFQEKGGRGSQKG